MIRRRPWLPFTVFALLVLVALLVSGLRARSIRASALGVPNFETVAVAAPRREVCEGPISSQDAFQSVYLAGHYVSGRPLVRIWRGQPGRSEVISSGLLEPSAPGSPGRYAATLNSVVGPGVTVNVCVIDAAGELRLQGYKPGYDGATIAGSKRRLAFSIVMVEPEQHSLVAALPLAFSRASLFRPSWMGSWTYWLLLIALVGVIPLGAVAVSAAMRSEQGSD